MWMQRPWYRVPVVVLGLGDTWMYVASLRRAFVVLYLAHGRPPGGPEGLVLAGPLSIGFQDPRVRKGAR